MGKKDLATNALFVKALETSETKMPTGGGQLLIEMARDAEARGYSFTGPGPKTAAEYRMLLLQFVGSLVLNGATGNTMDAIKVVLDRIGYKVDEDDHEDFRSAVQTALAKDGITTLYGSSLGDD